MKKIVITLILLIITILITIQTLPSFADDTILINGIGDVSIGEGNRIENIEVNGKNVWMELFSKYRELILGFSGVATLTMVLFFIVYFVKLGRTGDNPDARSSALSGLLWTGLATTGLGSITVLVAFFYNSLV